MSEGWASWSVMRWPWLCGAPWVGWLQARQAREVEVQRKKLTAQHDEKVLSQERELDRMHKSMKVRW